MKKNRILLSLIVLLSAASSCNQVDDDRIPALPVYINLSGAGMWNSYGVAGVGISRTFIHSKDLTKPSGFPYTANSYTGFGGVLLIGGVDPFTTEPNVPLAYDLACPVERDCNVRVAIDPDNLEAVCHKCGSRYDVVMAGGSPVGGPALTGTPKYGLRRYECTPDRAGGYIIHN